MKADSVVSILVRPDPPISLGADSYLDDLRFLGPYKETLAFAEKAATVKYGKRWRLAEVTEFFEETWSLETSGKALPEPELYPED